MDQLDFYDVVYQCKCNIITKKELLRVVVENAWYDKFITHWAENGLENMFDDDDLHCYMISLDIWPPESELTDNKLNGVFSTAWAKKDVATIRNLINRYPNLIGLDTNYIVNFKEYIDNAPFNIVSKRLKECFKIVFHQIRYNKAACFIIKSFSDFLNHVEPFIQYIDSQGRFDKMFHKLICGIVYLYETLLLNYLNIDYIEHLTDKKISEQFGIFLYNNPLVRTRIFSRLNITQIVNTCIKHVSEHNYVIRTIDHHTDDTFLSDRLSAIIYTFNIPLIVSLLNVYHIIKPRLTSIVLLYMYENKLIDEIPPECSVSKIYILRELYANETKLSLNNYIPDDVAELISEYVPYALYLGPPLDYSQLIPQTMLPACLNLMPE